MPVKNLFTTVTIATLLTSSVFAAQAPVSLAPKGKQQQTESYPLQNADPIQNNRQQPQSTPKTKQHAGASHFPATRQELEQAASDCEKQVQALWSERNQLERYRQPEFQRSIGAAQKFCRELKDIAKGITLADERLYSYQQSLDQAERCFSAG